MIIDISLSYFVIFNNNTYLYLIKMKSLTSKRIFITFRSCSCLLNSVMCLLKSKLRWGKYLTQRTVLTFHSRYLYLHRIFNPLSLCQLYQYFASTYDWFKVVSSNMATTKANYYLIQLRHSPPSFLVSCVNIDVSFSNYCVEWINTDTVTNLCLSDQLSTS